MAQLRPTLVTAICIYEGLAGLFTLGSQAFSLIIFYTVSPGAHTLPMHPLNNGVSLCSALLSFAIAGTLWFMRREAPFLSLAKVFLSLFAFTSLVYVLTNSRSHVAASIGSNLNAVLFSGYRVSSKQDFSSSASPSLSTSIESRSPRDHSLLHLKEQTTTSLSGHHLYPTRPFPKASSPSWCSISTSQPSTPPNATPSTPSSPRRLRHTLAPFPAQGSSNQPAAPAL